MADDFDPVITEAIQFLKFCNDADTMNRQEALEDLKFVVKNGDRELVLKYWKVKPRTEDIKDTVDTEDIEIFEE